MDSEGVTVLMPRKVLTVKAKLLSYPGAFLKGLVCSTCSYSAVSHKCINHSGLTILGIYTTSGSLNSQLRTNGGYMHFAFEWRRHEGVRRQNLELSFSCLSLILLLILNKLSRIRTFRVTFLDHPFKASEAVESFYSTKT